MKNILLFLLLLFSFLRSNSQGSFSKMFKVENNLTNGLDIAKAENGNYYVLSEYSVSGKSACAVSEFTETGSMIWTKYYINTDSMMSSPRIISLGHHGLLLAFEALPTYSTTLVFLDTVGNLLHTVRNDTIFSRGIAYSESDSSIVIGGFSYTFGLTLVKLDLNGNLLWTQLIDDLTNSIFDAWDIHVTAKNEIFFFGLGGSWGYIYWTTALLDSMGVPIQYWHSGDLMGYGNSYGMMVSTLLTGNRLLCVTSDLDINTNILEINFFKTDTMGKPVKWAKYIQPWNKSFNITNISVKDDAYIFGGNFFDTLLSAAGLLTLDTMLDFVSYTSVFDTTQVESWDAYLCTNTSGGIMMAGSCTSSPGQAYFAKTDSNNLIACSLPLPRWTPAAFDILDTLQVTIIDSSLTHYYYSDPGYIQWGNALYGEMEFCEPTIVSENKNIEEYNVYPNPASSILRFHSLDYQQTELSYSITDLSGKEIYKDILRTDESLIDIRSLSPGLYFISVLGSEKKEVHKFIKTAVN